MLKKFIKPSQLNFINMLTQGEEGAHFTELLQTFTERIRSMPGPGEQSEAKDPIVYLHYFGSNSDHWVIERDPLDGEQEQCFCFACLNGWKDCAELGYVSLEEILAAGVELDLYFEPKPLSQVKREGGFR